MDNLLVIQQKNEVTSDQKHDGVASADLVLFLLLKVVSLGHLVLVHCFLRIFLLVVTEKLN